MTHLGSDIRLHKQVVSRHFRLPSSYWPRRKPDMAPCTIATEHRICYDIRDHALCAQSESTVTEASLYDTTQARS
jgi:hypothetical protein